MSESTKPQLGQPRIYVEVLREIGDTGTYIRSRKEISLHLWRGAIYQSVIAVSVINECLLESEAYGETQL